MDKECYLYECSRFPDCALAVSGCAMEFDSEKTAVEPGQCCKENGYPFFTEKKHKFYKPEQGR